MSNNNGLYQYRDKISSKMITYIDLNTLKRKHPDGDYSIVGEIDIKAKDVNGISKKVLDDDIYIYVKSIGTYKESNYKTIGYIPCENDEYVIVKKKSYSKLILPLILTLLLLLGLIGGYLLMGDKADIDPNAGDYISSLKRPDNIDESKILIPGYGKFTIKKGTDSLDTVFFNPEGNPCFFKFELVEKQSGDVLYESKLVPPGKGISTIKLNKKFDKVGSYDAVLRFNTVDLENTKISYNGSDIDVKLNVVE